MLEFEKSATSYLRVVLSVITLSVNCQLISDSGVYLCFEVLLSPFQGHMGEILPSEV